MQSFERDFYVDNLRVKKYISREEMGKAAAIETADRIKSLLEQKDEINIIFAAAPSQNELLENLATKDGIVWSRINAFHMDEYIGLDKEAPQGFGNFLKSRLFEKLPFKSVNYINGQENEPAWECSRYSQLLQDYPADIVCMGIGENGHIAFNDPHVAFFDDKEMVKIVDLDEACRLQQVNDGCFKSIDRVPKCAITLTIPTLVRADYICCVVPGKTKAKAVYTTLNGPIDETCPASILRNHKNAILYIDNDSGSEL